MITLIGAAIRLFLVNHYDFPLNDGGLFYTMVSDIVANGYKLPAFTTYNQAQIPFAYPPLPFYIVILIHNIFRIDLISIFHYLPLTYSILAIPAFYKLSSAMLDSEVQIIHATLAFAITAPAFEWNIMGGGITRAPGYLFSILAIYYAARNFKTYDGKRFVYSIIFLGLTGYCHLEILFVTVAFISVIFLFSNFRVTYQIFVGLLLGALLVLSPYIFRTISIYGLRTFVTVFQSGEFNLLNSVGKFLLSNLTGEYLYTPILVIATLAFVRCLIRNEYLLPVLTLVPIFANPRSLERSMIIPICLLAGYGIETIVLAALRGKTNDRDQDAMLSGKTDLGRSLFPNRSSALLIGYLFIHSMIFGVLFLLESPSTIEALATPDRQAMAWVHNNTTSESTFLVLTPYSNWETNQRLEWFPALSNRRSVLTVQGTEWLDDQQFSKQQDIYQEINHCALENLECIDELTEQERISFTHIYLSGTLTDKLTGFETPLPIQNELLTSKMYALIYKDARVLIFSRSNTGQGN